MADIQHSQIQDPDIHEPKGASSASVNSVYLSDGQGSGDWTPTTDIPLPTGWENHEDSTYTSTSPLSVSSNTRTQLTIDGLGDRTNTEYSPVSTDLWNTTDNAIVPENVGDVYDLRLRFKAEPGVSDGYITIELDIGGDDPIIVAQTQRFLKGNALQNMLFISTVFTLDTFVANGGSIYLTSSVDVDLYDIGLLINRTHKAT